MHPAPATRPQISKSKLVRNLARARYVDAQIMARHDLLVLAFRDLGHVSRKDPARAFASLGNVLDVLSLVD